ncbi:hypothetical protein ACLB2K_046958 [Fragaria x ananassa]
MWKANMAPKIKVFGWLLLQDRLKTRSRLHRNKAFSAHAIVACAASYHHPTPRATIIIRLPLNHNVTIKWKPPPRGAIKINFDGFIQQPSSNGGVGFLLRDEIWCLVVAVACYIGKTIVPFTKTTALRDNLLKARDLNIKNVVVEGDSSLIINCVIGKFKCPWKLFQIMQDIRTIATFFECISFHHVLHEANFVANALTNLGHNYSNMQCWETCLPAPVSQVVNFDLFGMGCSRVFPCVTSLLALNEKTK